MRSETQQEEEWADKAWKVRVSLQNGHSLIPGFSVVEGVMVKDMVIKEVGRRVLEAGISATRGYSIGSPFQAIKGDQDTDKEAFNKMNARDLRAAPNSVKNSVLALS